MAVPEQIVVEILSRLPVESLSRFKAVCRAWNSIIQNPWFINLCWNLAVPKENTAIFLSNFRQIYSIDITDATDPFARNVKTVQLELDARLVGSCRGLTCLLVADLNVMIRNLSTGFCREFSPSSASSSSDGLIVTRNGNVAESCHEIYGFGYVSSIDDFKVVRLPLKLLHQENNDAKAQILALKTRTWRTIPDFPIGNRGMKPYDCSNQVPLLLNESLHWILADAARNQFGLPMKVIIYSFSLGEEKGLTLAMPKTARTTIQPVYQLGVCRGCLCLIGWLHFPLGESDHLINVWLMKDEEEDGDGLNKNERSWTLLVTVNYKIPFTGWLKPMASTRNEEIILRYYASSRRKGSNFVVFSLKETSFSFRDLNIHHVLSTDFVKDEAAASVQGFSELNQNQTIGKRAKTRDQPIRERRLPAKLRQYYVLYK